MGLMSRITKATQVSAATREQQTRPVSLLKHAEQLRGLARIAIAESAEQPSAESAPAEPPRMLALNDEKKKRLRRFSATRARGSTLSRRSQSFLRPSIPCRAA